MIIVNMNVVEILDKVIKALGVSLTVKVRVAKTIGEGVKILTAVNAADLGETEKAVASRLLTIAQNLEQLLGPTA